MSRRSPARWEPERERHVPKSREGSAVDPRKQLVCLILCPKCRMLALRASPPATTGLPLRRPIWRRSPACRLRSELCMTTRGVSRAPDLPIRSVGVGLPSRSLAQGRRLLGALLATCCSNGSAPRPIRRRPAPPAPQGRSTYSRARFRVRESLVWGAGNLGERVSSDAHAVLSEAFELLLGAHDERVEIEPSEPRVVGEGAAERLPQ